MLSNSIHAKLVWRPSVCYFPIYYMQNCDNLYLVPLLLHRICNLLACAAVLFVACVSKLSRVCGTVATTGDSKSPGLRIESATANVLFNKAHFFIFLNSLYRAADLSFSRQCSEAKLHLCVHS